jgi:hypothetical protein
MNKKIGTKEVIMRPSCLLSAVSLKNMPARLPASLSILAILTLSTGCAEISGAVGHGWEGEDYNDRYLSTSSPLGAKAIKNWRNYDIDVRKFLQDNRDPDVIYSKPLEVTFFYLKEKIQVRCRRPALGYVTKIERTAIPEDLYEIVSKVVAY